MPRRLTLVALSAILCLSASAEDDSVVGQARAHVAAAQWAAAQPPRREGHADAALDEALQAYALRPNHAGIAFEVAAAYAAAGRLDDATRILRLVAEMGIPFRTDARAELGDCGRKRPACREALAAIEASRAPRTASTIAFRIPVPRLLPEGLAYDAKGDSFFVSSVRQRRVLRVDRSGRAQPFADRTAGLWAALGMAIDSTRGR